VQLVLVVLSIDVDGPAQAQGNDAEPVAPEEHARQRDVAGQCSCRPILRAENKRRLPRNVKSIEHRPTHEGATGLHCPNVTCRIKRQVGRRPRPLVSSSCSACILLFIPTNGSRGHFGDPCPQYFRQNNLPPMAPVAVRACLPPVRRLRQASLWRRCDDRRHSGSPAALAIASTR